MVWCGAIHDEVDTITSYQLLILGPAVATAGMAERAPGSSLASLGQSNFFGSAFEVPRGITT
jgi:hypothetical protein